MALSIATKPWILPWAPDEAAERPEKRATMPAAVIYLLVRDRVTER